MSTRRPVALITNNHHRACWRMAHRCNRRLTSPWRHCWRARIHDRPANRRHSSSKLTAGTTHRESRPFSRQVGAGRNDDEAAWYPSVRGTLTIWPTGCRLDVDHACMSPCTYYIYQMKDVYWLFLLVIAMGCLGDSIGPGALEEMGPRIRQEPNYGWLCSAEAVRFSSIGLMNETENS